MGKRGVPVLANTVGAPLVGAPRNRMPECVMETESLRFTTRLGIRGGAPTRGAPTWPRDPPPSSAKSPNFPPTDVSNPPTLGNNPFGKAVPIGNSSGVEKSFASFAKRSIDFEPPRDRVNRTCRGGAKSASIVPVFRALPALPVGFPQNPAADACELPRSRFSGRYQRAGFAARTTTLLCRPPLSRGANGPAPPTGSPP